MEVIIRLNTIKNLTKSQYIYYFKQQNNNSFYGKYYFNIILSTVVGYKKK